MSTPEEMKSSAIERVTEVLSRRLRQGGRSTGQPDLYFQCEADEPQAYPGGFQVRIHTWRHWSDARVAFDADTGEVMAYSILRYADPLNDEEMTREEALAAASEAIQVPDDAVLKTFYHFEYGKNRKLARLEWKRIYQGLRVDGDTLRVTLHPKTHRIVEYFRKWRKLNLK